jgi:hypothetical protein
VDGLLTCKDINNDHIKQCINEIIANRSRKISPLQKLKKTNTINGMLSIIEKNISYVSNELSQNGFSSIPENEQAIIDLYVDKIKKSFEILKKIIHDLKKGYETMIPGEIIQSAKHADLPIILKKLGVNIIEERGKKFLPTRT